MSHRRPSKWKCVEGREKECATEEPERPVRRQAALRTSGKCATEGRSGRSAFQGGKRNVPQRGLGGRFGAERLYALPQNVPQKAVQVEVRGRVGKGMCHGGAWEGTSGRHGVTHFRKKCRRRPFRAKCVSGREKECATEGPGGLLRVLLVRASAQAPLMEMRGRQVGWKCAQVQKTRSTQEVRAGYPPGPDYRLFGPSR